MANKLSVAIVIAMFACCAQAGLEKFGDLGSGEVGFYKHCFTHMSLSNLIEGYHKQTVAASLAADRLEVDAKLDTDFAAFGRSEACSRYCFDIIVDREYPRNYPGERELDASRCRHFVRFKHLCELVRNEKSADLRVISIERWLCLTRIRLHESLHSGYFKCQEVNGYPEAFKREAETELDSVLSYSLEELREKEKESAQEIEASNKLRRQLDVKISTEAYSKVNQGMDQLPRYIKCSKQQIIDRADKREAEAKKEIEDRHRKELKRQRDARQAAMKKRDEYLVTSEMFTELGLGAHGG